MSAGREPGYRATVQPQGRSGPLQQTAQTYDHPVSARQDTCCQSRLLPPCAWIHCLRAAIRCAWNIDEGATQEDLPLQMAGALRLSRLTYSRLLCCPDHCIDCMRACGQAQIDLESDAEVAYARLGALCQAIKNELQNDLKIHDAAILPSYVNLPQVTAAEYSTVRSPAVHQSRFHQYEIGSTKVLNEPHGKVRHSLLLVLQCMYQDLLLAGKQIFDGVACADT